MRYHSHSVRLHQGHRCQRGKKNTIIMLKWYLAYCSEHDKCRVNVHVWLRWSLREDSGLVSQKQPRALTGFYPVCISVGVRHWHRATVTVLRGSVALRCWGRKADMSTEAAGQWFTVTAPLGMWGQQASQARLLPLIFICSTVCFAFKSLAEHKALDTPWMAQVHF